MSEGEVLKRFDALSSNLDALLSKFGALEEEFAALRREVVEMKRANGVHYHHHHAAPLPLAPLYMPYQAPYPYAPGPTMCETSDTSRKYALPTAAGGGAVMPAALDVPGHNICIAEQLPGAVNRA